MRYLMSLVVAGGLLLGTAGTSKAQVAVSIGNGFTGQGLSVVTPGYGYPNYGYSNYGYSGYGVPGAYSYSSGYSGYVAPVAPISPYGYGYGARPYYGSYGYRGYGPRYGYRPFGGVVRRFR